MLREIGNMVTTLVFKALETVASHGVSQTAEGEEEGNWQHALTPVVFKVLETAIAWSQPGCRGKGRGRLATW